MNSTDILSKIPDHEVKADICGCYGIKDKKMSLVWEVYSKRNLSCLQERDRIFSTRTVLS